MNSSPFPSWLRRLWLAFWRPVAVPDPGPLPRPLSRAWFRRHWLSMVALGVALAVAGGVHGLGMDGYPGYPNGDEGIYLSQAWAVIARHTLTPFSYFYDHAPGGWVLIAGYVWLTRAFQRDPTALMAGRECMLVVHLITCALLFGLARRLGLRRSFAALAVALFSLSPLEVLYQRLVLLDNPMVLWIVAGLFCLASPRRSLGSGLLAGICFALAFLSKETMAVLVPALLLAFWDFTDARNRLMRAVLFFGTWIGFATMYLVYAANKSELLPGLGHNSLVGTLLWQFSQRKSTGSLFDVHSQTFAMAMSWLHLDPVMLLAGLACVPLALAQKRLRAIALLLLSQLAVMVHDGYLPYAHVTMFFPLCALVVAGVADRCWTAGLQRDRATEYRPTRLVRGLTAATRLALLVAMAVAIIVVTPLWRPALVTATTARPDDSLRRAAIYVAAHVPRGQKTLLVTDNYCWTDTVRHGRPDAVTIDKLELDPAVRGLLEGRDWRGIGYILAAPLDDAAKGAYPITARALQRAVPVAEFGNENETLTLWRVGTTPSTAG